MVLGVQCLFPGVMCPVRLARLACMVCLVCLACWLFVRARFYRSRFFLLILSFRIASLVISSKIRMALISGLCVHTTAT